jgi:twitching motility protein PilT
MHGFVETLQAAVAAGASDVHFKTESPVVFRVDGALVETEGLRPDAAWFEALIEAIVPGRLRVALERDGELDFSHEIAAVGRFRCNLYQQRGVWCLALRLVRSQVPLPGELALPPVVATLAGASRGIVLVSGPTGSGKSTTLAALIGEINRASRRHVITLEDPIEFVFEDDQARIEQREIGIDTPGYAQALRSVLRQDPDVILIGEMRDAESFTTALRAAETGHLVLTTLHASDAAQAVGRALEFFEPGEHEQVRRQLADNLRAVICQRMVAKVGGGVTVAVEVLLNSPTVRKLLQENRLEMLPDAVETGGADGMITFNQSLLDLHRRGVITKEEALAKSGNAAALRMNLQGIFLDEGRRIMNR